MAPLFYSSEFILYICSMTDNYIVIGNFVLYEPTTVLTDLIISGLSFFFFNTLNKQPRTIAIKNWSFFFLFFGLSTFIGAFSHAFFQLHDGVAYKSFWLCMQVLNGVAVLFSQKATFDKKWDRLFLIQFLIFVVAVFLFQKFLVVIINNALSLVPIMIFHYRISKTKISGMYIANGILVSFATALVHGFKLSFHTFFNYNDIAHLLIMLSLYIMYKGIRMKAAE